MWGVTKQATSPIRNDLWPSSKVTLIVRFDEFNTLNSSGDPVVASQAPPVPINTAKGFSAQLAPLTVVQDQTVPNVRKFNIVPQGQQSTPQGGPQGQSGSQDGLTQVVAGIIPKQATWNQNGIRAGDTLSLSIRFLDCPIDPRTIRSCAVEWYFGTVDSDQYAQGVTGSTRTAQAGSTEYLEPLNVIPDAYTDDDGNQRTNLRFQGFVDNKWEVEFDGDNEPVINLECVDNTHLLINLEAPPKLAISPTLPIDQAIAGYLANFPTFNGLSVSYVPSTQPDNWPSDLTFPPSLGQALAGTAFIPQLGPTPAKGGGAESKLNVWDYLTDACSAIGHNIYVDGTSIIITQVQTLLSNQTARRADDPFQGRTVDGQLLNYRRMLWGRNLGKLTFRRNFTKRQPTGIEVRSYQTRRKQDMVVRFPDPVTQKNLLPVTSRPGDGTTEQKWLVWKVGKNITSRSVLLLIAQNIYQSVGRMQFEVEAETNNLGSFGAATLDPDILDAKPGDTIELLLVRDPELASLTATEDALLVDAQQEMTGLGFSSDFATAYATAYTNAGFQTLYRLRTMSVDWNTDDDEEPVKISMTLVNYVEVRVDQPFIPQGGSSGGGSSNTT